VNPHFIHGSLKSPLGPMSRSTNPLLPVGNLPNPWPPRSFSSSLLARPTRWRRAISRGTSSHCAAHYTHPRRRSGETLALTFPLPLPFRRRRPLIFASSASPSRRFRSRFVLFRVMSAVAGRRLALDEHEPPLVGGRGARENDGEVLAAGGAPAAEPATAAPPPRRRGG
jgi:hypothetical protein